MVTNIASAVTTFIFNIILMRLAGANGVAAITVLLYAHFLFSSAYMGFTNGVAPIFSYNYGAGNYADLKKLFAMCIRILLAAGGCDICNIPISSWMDNAHFCRK